MRLAQRLYLSMTSGATQRPFLTLEEVLDHEGYRTTFVAEASDQRNKITGRSLAHEEHPAQLFHDATPPGEQMRAFRLLLAGTGPNDTIVPLSIHQDIVSVCHFLGRHITSGKHPLLYRADTDPTAEDPYQITLSPPFNLTTEHRFSTTDRYNPSTRTGHQTITTPNQPDAPLAILQPKHHSIKVDALVCEPPLTTLLPIPGTEQQTHFTLMLRNRNTKEPLSLHPTTESLAFFANRFNQIGRVLELVNARGETINV